MLPVYSLLSSVTDVHFAFNFKSKQNDKSSNKFLSHRFSDVFKYSKLWKFK